MTPRTLAPDINDSALAKDATLKTLPNEPIEPILNADPTDPILNTELRDPTLSTESSDAMLQPLDMVARLPNPEAGRAICAGHSAFLRIGAPAPVPSAQRRRLRPSFVELEALCRVYG
jgi:hypothetical protein